MIYNLDAVISGQATATFGGARTTAKLLAILGKLDKSEIPTIRQIDSVGPFPVAGLAYWVDDWHAYRCCPVPHLHQGIDMMADRGTPLVSVANGVISEQTFDPVWSGLAIGITDHSGTRYLYFHLSAFASGIHVGKRVRIGDVIGYVGNTGDASGGPTHLHFEVHPYGGGPVPPKPYVDRWLDAAQIRAFKLVRRLTGKRITDKDLDLSLWKNRLLELAQGELNQANLAAARQPAKPRVVSRPDQQAVAYSLPLILLAILAAGLLFIDRSGVQVWPLRTRRRAENEGPALGPIVDLAIITDAGDLTDVEGPTTVDDGRAEQPSEDEGTDVLVPQ